MVDEKKKPESLFVEATPVLRYRYAAGEYGSRFLAALREKKILGSRCRRCGWVLVPPRIACSGCFLRMAEFVEVALQGTLVAFTQVTFPFLDPFTGEQRPIPYCYGMVRLDGTHNTFQYFLEEKDVRKLRPGLRVEAVFREAREGAIRDILHFRSL